MGTSNRTFAILGDSISTYEGCIPDGFAVFYTAERAAEAGMAGPQDAWWSLVAARLDGTVLANASYSGSMVAGEGFPAGWSSRRIQALVGPGGEVPTDVLVFMGTNDYGWGSARAQAAGRSSATPPCVDLSKVPEAAAGAATTADLEDFARAYETMLTAVRQTCPGASVWCLDLLPGRVVGSAGPTFAWNLRGIPMTDYNATIRAVALQCGCHPVEAASFGLDYEALDGTHPTARGMRQIAAMALAAMGQADPREALDSDPFEPSGSEDPRDGWASLELCPDRACLGCEHARGTGSKWYCVCERDLAVGH